MAALSAKLAPVEFEKGETSKNIVYFYIWIVIKKGDDANCMYILY